MRSALSVLIFWLVFETVAVGLWLWLDNPFYLWNFSYIGTCLALGIWFYSKNWKYARNAVQFAVGLYMLVYLGILSGENMQLEGFWYYLFSGTFEAAVIHYLVAKIGGPLLFGRGWCGYACWTAMLLDLLPYPLPQKPRKKLAWPRYLLFALSFAFVGALFLWDVPDKESILFAAFLIGNLLYYAAGTALALALRDNRAFCKYLCPVTVFLKPASRCALLRVRCDESTCVHCGKCRRACPMEVGLPDNSRRRENATECILCLRCVRECPKGALKL